MSDSLIGKKLGDYQIRELLGKGGMARVYLGYDEHLDRRAAVKVINNDITARERDEYFKRFQNEARAIARLDHPNIVRVYQFGAYEDVYYMAMVFVDGKDLRHILRQAAERKTQLPLTEALTITRQIGSALDYAHSRGVIHRDVKPSNIMVTLEGQAILTDFGLALSSTEGTLGETFGSAHYIAPEQAVSSANAVPQSDLYSLGICVFEMLTGRVPFDDPSAMSVALKHVNAPVPLLSSINPSVPEAFEPVVARALEKEPGKRFPSGEAFAQALLAAFESRSASRILGSPSLASIRATGRPAEPTPPVLPAVEASGSRPKPVPTPLPTPRPDTSSTPPRTTYHFGPPSKPDARLAQSAAPDRAVDSTGVRAALKLPPQEKPAAAPPKPPVTPAKPASAPVKEAIRPRRGPRVAIVVVIGAIVLTAAAFGLTATRSNPGTPTNAPGTSAAFAGSPTVALLAGSGTPPLNATSAGPTATNAVQTVQASPAASEASQPVPDTTPTLPSSPVTLHPILSTVEPVANGPTGTTAAPPAVTPLFVVTAVNLPTASRPSALLIWDSYQLSFINDSDEYVSVKHLTFTSKGRVETRQFTGSQWTRPPDGNYSDLLRPGQCYQLGRIGQLLPPAFSPCTGTAAYWQPGPSGQFWISDDGRPDAQFEVYLDTTRIATCLISAGRCQVAFPPAS